MARSSTSGRGIQVGLLVVQEFLGVEAAFQGLAARWLIQRFRQVLAAGATRLIHLKEPLPMAHFHLGQLHEQVL